MVGREVVRRVADPWAMLGVKRGVGAKAAKTAFQKAAMKWHPDAPGGDAAKFMDVQVAYKQVLEAEHLVGRAEGEFGDSSSARQGSKIASQGRMTRRRPRVSRLDPTQKWEVNAEGKVQHTSETYWHQQDQHKKQKEAEDQFRERVAGAERKQEEKAEEKKNAAKGEPSMKDELPTAKDLEQIGSFIRAPEYAGAIAVAILVVGGYLFTTYGHHLLPEPAPEVKVSHHPSRKAVREFDAQIQGRYEAVKHQRCERDLLWRS
eukprot:TRINITY_DN17564_c0_g1_i1.p1 TRINITY_DN17564_c0_g1~~TRINITY_DN17564_c0_g1_i1.p1  ORF type:complete len:261 (+),score=86.81 TRINITY_DN17564_c0_g1_i1:98-880(+)